MAAPSSSSSSAYPTIPRQPSLGPINYLSLSQPVVFTYADADANNDVLGNLDVASHSKNARIHAASLREPTAGELEKSCLAQVAILQEKLTKVAEERAAQKEKVEILKVVKSQREKERKEQAAAESEPGNRNVSSPPTYKSVVSPSSVSPAAAAASPPSSQTAVSPWQREILDDLTGICSLSIGDADAATSLLRSCDWSLSEASDLFYEYGRDLHLAASAAFHSSEAKRERGGNQENGNLNGNGDRNNAREVNVAVNGGGRKPRGGYHSIESSENKGNENNPISSNNSNSNMSANVPMTTFHLEFPNTGKKDVTLPTSATVGDLYRYITENLDHNGIYLTPSDFAFKVEGYKGVNYTNNSTFPLSAFVESEKSIIYILPPSF